MDERLAMDTRLAMDARLERDLRVGLAALLDPVAGSHPRWATSPAAERVLSLPERRRSGRLGLLWAAALVALLLLATMAAALFMGSQPDKAVVVVAPTPTPTPGVTATPGPATANGPFAKAPIGIDELRPAQQAYGTIVADGNGILWAHDYLGSRIVRYDPTTGSGLTWAVGYEAIQTTDLAPARAGGVWLVGPRTLRRFDGTDIREVIEAPGEIGPATEARNGDLWAVTSAPDALIRWDGSSWSRLDVPRPDSKPASSSIEVVFVDAGGHPWIGWTIQDEGNNATGLGWLAHHDGTAWITDDAGTTPPLGGRVWAITQASDAAMWVATAAGLARFDGTTWTDATDWPNTGYPGTLSVAVAPDGAVWAAGNDPGDAAFVRRFDGASWTRYGTADGVPGGAPTTTVLPVAGDMYLGAGTGIYRLAGTRWERVWPTDAALTAPPAYPDGTRLLAISRDELWAAGEDGAWHFLGGSWTKESIDPDRPGGRVDDLAIAPDGTVWAAGANGVAYRRDGRWVVADSTSAGVITIDRDGTVWAAGPGSDCIWALRLTGTTWTHTPAARCPSNLTIGGSVTSMAVDGRGTLWAGAGGFVVDALASYADGRWATYESFTGLPPTTDVTVLGIAPNGDPWIAAESYEADGSSWPWTAHFDGTAWTVIRGPEGDAAAAAAGLGDRAVAPDGTRFEVRGDGSFVRLSAPSPSP